MLPLENTDGYIHNFVVAYVATTKLKLVVALRREHTRPYKPIPSPCRKMSKSSAATAKSSKSASAAAGIQSVKANPDLVENVADYIPFSQEVLRKFPSATLTAALNVLNCYTADMFLIVLQIMSDKYGHNIDDVLATIKADERWEHAKAHPLVKSMTYFTDEDIDKSMGTALSRKTVAEIPTEELHDEVKPAKRSKKAAATVEEAADAEAADAVPPAPAKKSSKKAKAVEVAPAEEAAPAEEPPAPAKKSSKKVKEIVEEAASAAADEASPVTPKKSSKKTKAAEPEEAAAEVPPPAPKKSSKKAKTAEAAAPAVPVVDDEVEALVTNVSAMSIEAAPKVKKVINKKPKSAAAE